MSSTAWDRFKDSLDRGVTGPADLESLDLVALRQLDDLEKERARQLLAAKIGDGDPRIVDALGELDTPKAWADVERAFTSSYGSAQVHAAMWLWRRNQDARVVPKLKELANSNPDAPTFVNEVLLALARIPGEEVDEILLDVLATSQQPRVNIVARDSLFQRHDLEKWDHEGSLVFALRSGLRSTFPSVRAAAVAELRSLLKRRGAGESDAQLGIVAQPLAGRSAALEAILQLAFHPDSAPLPDNAALDTLQGGERLWAADLLIGRLEQGDARVIPLLQHLGGDREKLALADQAAGRHI